MKLEQLLEGVPFTLVQGSLDTEVQDIIYDSRKAAPGLAFVCIVGTQRDSHEFAADCAAKGVSALVIQHDIDLSAMPGVTVVKVESSRYAMALMSANLFGNPSRKMTMIGVTGETAEGTATDDTAPAEGEAAADAAAAQPADATAAAAEETPLTDPARMTTNNEENPM